MPIRTAMHFVLVLILLTGRASAEGRWFLVEPPAADPSIESGRTELAESPPGPPPGLSLELHPALPQPGAEARSPVSAVLGTTADTPPRTKPAPPSRLRVNAGIGFALPDNPPVSVSADLIGREPSQRAPITVSNGRPFGTQADMRTPQREAGVGVAYTLPSDGGLQVSLDSRFDVIRHSEAEKPASQGTAGIWVKF